jgi:enoyl-CoA hydratase/carnithine racemase
MTSPGVAHVALRSPDDLSPVFEAIAIPGVLAAVVSFVGDAWSLASDLTRVRALATAEEARALAASEHAEMKRLRLLNKPIVAILDGHVDGAALEVALHCDARVATTEATLAFGAIDVGLIPRRGSLARLATIAGAEAAITIASATHRRTALDAVRDRLVRSVVPRGAIENAATELALVLANAERPSRAAAAFGAARSRDVVPLVARRAKRFMQSGVPPHEPAPARLVEVVEAWAARGVDAALGVEASVFGDLVMSSVARALWRLFDTTGGTSLTSEAAKEATWHMGCALVQEASHIVAAGVPAHEVEAALVAWGFRIGPFAMARELGIESGTATSAPVELMRYPEVIQTRCALALVRAAQLVCDRPGLDSAAVDLAAVVGLGFPRFRGGPLHYAATVGEAELKWRSRAVDFSS